MCRATWSLVSLVSLVMVTLVQSCPDYLVNVTRCNRVDRVEDIIGPSAPTCTYDPTFRVSNALDWAYNCSLPVEIRVGLTMSLTGNLSDASYNENVLELLKEWSSQTSNQSVTPMKLQGLNLDIVRWCPRFCVMDDESSEQKMVELYRSFAGDGTSAPPSQIWLGPSTYSFRNAAAQVANEYQTPIILWSIPHLWRNFSIDHSQAAATAASLEPPSTTTRLIKDQISATTRVSSGLYSSLYSYAADSCKSFPVPAGYYLRTGAEYLSCNGPCDPVLHLDLCARPANGLAVSGAWEPSWALANGGWQDGCLLVQHFANETTNVSLTLSFPRSTAHVTISRKSEKNAVPSPYLVVENQLFEGGTSDDDVLPDGTKVSFTYSGDANVSWEICLRESCQVMTCSSPELQVPSRYCRGKVCDASDTARCCSVEPEGLNGALNKSGFNAAFDMVPPVSHWALDAIDRINAANGERVLCVAEASSEQSFFANLCRFYADRLTGQTEVRLAHQPLTAVWAAVRLRPSATVVLVCSDFDFYIRWTQASIAIYPDHGAVLSCLPFGSLMMDIVTGFELNFRSLEPQPWPSFRELVSVQPLGPFGRETDLASLRRPFGELYQERLQRNGSFPTELLFLYSAWQVMDYVAMEVSHKVLQYSFLQQHGRRDVFVKLSGDKISTFLNDKMEFDDTGLQKLSLPPRRGVATRQFAPWGEQEEIAGSAPNVSWAKKMARYLRSAIRVADSSQDILPVRYEANVDEMYPCPVGCVVAQDACSACPPGKFRSLIHRTCEPCLNGSYQDNYAAASCFSCPLHTTCNATGPPVAEPGYYVFVNETHERTYRSWSGPDACSILPGGGLFIVNPKDVSSWTASKNESKWEVIACASPELCLGENVCPASKSGFACQECETGYSRMLNSGQVCLVCPLFSQLVWKSAGIALVQCLAAALISWATLLDAKSVGHVAGPVLLTLLKGVQSFWIFLDLALSVSLISITNDASYAWLRTVTDPFMMPFLVPLLDCSPDSSMSRSVYARGWAVLLSAIAEYALLLLPWLLCSFKRNRHLTWSSLLGPIISMNRVVLPGVAFWTFKVALHCEANSIAAIDAEACEDQADTLQSPHVLLCACAWLLIVIFLEGYALWARRHDFFQVAYHQQFGALCNGLHRQYLLWPVWEGSYLVFIAIVASLTEGLGLGLIGLGCTVVMQSFSCLLLKISFPYILGVLPAFKRMIALQLSFLPILPVCRPIVAQSVQEADVLVYDQIAKIIIALAFVQMFATVLWYFCVNRVMIPLSVMEDTFVELKCRWLVDALRRLLGLHRLLVNKHHDHIEFFARRWSKSQRREFVGVIESMIWAHFAVGGTFSMSEVHMMLEDVVRNVCRSRKVAIVQHLNQDVSIAAKVAYREGRPISECIQRRAGLILATELTIAAQDVISLRREEGKTSLSSSLPKKDPDPEALEALEEEVVEGTKLPPAPVPKNTKVILQRMERSRVRASTYSSSGTATVSEEEDLEMIHSVYGLIRKYKHLTRKSDTLARAAQNSLPQAMRVGQSFRLLKEEVKTFALLTAEIERMVDTFEVEDIPLHELKDLIAQAQRLIDPTKVEKAATEDPEVLELFGESEDGSNRNGAEDHGHNGNECNAGNAGGNAEAGFAFSTSGEVIEDASWRSRSEDSLSLPGLQEASSKHSERGMAAMTVLTMNSKPRRVGKSTTRLHRCAVTNE